MLRQLAVGLMFGCLAQLSLAAELAMSFRDTSGAPLADVVVALVPKVAVASRTATSSAATSSSAPAIMDQINLHFVPKVLTVSTNTWVQFPNRDDVRHQVYSFSPAKKFELRLYHGKAASPVQFDKPGKVVLGCNIHDSMLGYIYVVDTPYFAQSDSAGTLLLQAPAGDYELQIFFYRATEEVAVQPLTLAADEHWQRQMTLATLADTDDYGSSDEFADLFK